MAKGTGGSEAELLYHKWLLTKEWTVHRARTFYVPLAGQFIGRTCPVCHRGKPKIINQSTDIWGVFDFLAFNSEDLWAVQITTPTNRSARRRKISNAGPFPPLMKIAVVVHETEPHPNHKARRLHFWKTEQYVDQTWQVPHLIRFDKTALTKLNLKQLILEQSTR